jgi:hypothetical protein
MSLVEITTPSQSARIKELNDRFRSTFVGGVVTLTHGMNALCREVRAEVLRRVRAFDHFNQDNDPHQEHDYGSFVIAGQRFFFKIDYYDHELQNGSENPADTSETTRVLTVGFLSEY